MRVGGGRYGSKWLGCMAHLNLFVLLPQSCGKVPENSDWMKLAGGELYSPTYLLSGHAFCFTLSYLLFYRTISPYNKSIRSSTPDEQV